MYMNIWLICTWIYEWFVQIKSSSRVSPYTDNLNSWLGQIIQRDAGQLAVEIVDVETTGTEYNIGIAGVQTTGIEYNIEIVYVETTGTV